MSLHDSINVSHERRRRLGESLYHTETIIIAYWVVVIRLPKFSALALHPFRIYFFFSLLLTFVARGSRTI